MIWFPIFYIAELQHAFSTRMMGPIWMNFGTYMYFFTLIRMVHKFLEFSPSVRYFSHLLDWGQFCRFHSTGCIKQAENLCLGVNLHAESHDQKSFPKFKSFTLSRSKVWNLPIVSTIKMTDQISLSELFRSLQKKLNREAYLENCR